MFIDKVHLVCKAGRGGDGKVSFAINGKPNGGDGGMGGNVYLEGSHDLTDLSHLSEKKNLAAEPGGVGGREQQQGKNGKDLIIKVPLITSVIDIFSNKIISITSHGQRELLLKGGSGGIGNYYYRKGQKATLTKFTYGKHGQEFNGFFELLLESDIVFLGLPNAGKSSLLNALTNTNVKVAAYPFTTLMPHLGICNGIRLLDLPGLIEGTKQGKGLGTRFTRHVKLAKLVAHVISLENESVADTYKLMRKEFEEIGPDVSNKPEIVILNKTDVTTPAKIKQAQKDLKKFKSIKEILVSSVYDFDNLQLIKTKLNELVAAHEFYEDENIY